MITTSSASSVLPSVSRTASWYPRPAGIAEPCRGEEARAGIDQWKTQDPESGSEIRRLGAQRGCKKRPGAPVKKLEKAAVENDTGRIAVSPFDGELPPADEIGHGVVPFTSSSKRRFAVDVKSMPPESRAGNDEACLRMHHQPARNFPIAA